MRHVVDQDRAGPALRAVTAEFGTREPELVAQGHRERLVGENIDAAESDH